MVYCILVKDHIAIHCHSMDTFSSESILLWLSINKNVLGIDCIIGAVYIPYERSDYYHDDIYDGFVDDIITIKATFKTPVILMGDFNLRTGVAPDFEQMPENECSIFEESPSSIYFDTLNISNRVNKDKCLNDNGKKLIELCKISDL